MLDLSLQEIGRATGGRLTGGNPETRIHEISIDSRKVPSGSLFIAIQGERFDGHDFINAAITAGAVAVVVSREVLTEPAVAVIRVNNTLEALGKIAAYHREQFSVPVIGITGSNGKTTTKDLVASILQQERVIVKTEANFNNEIGLPLTLFKMTPATQVTVVEMGMRGLGQIRQLMEIARPTLGIVTNVGMTHLELLGSQENIARAKAELVEALPPSGLAVLNGDEPLVRAMQSKTSAPAVFYGIDGPGLDYRAMDITVKNNATLFRVDARGELLEITLPMPGRHNVLNALAAIAATKELGIRNQAIVRGLAEPELTGKRLRVIRQDKFTVIDDTYNASPASLKAALDVLADAHDGGRKLAVLADMLELGRQTDEIHYEMGSYAASHGIDCLLTFGDLASRYVAGYTGAGGAYGQHFADKELLIRELHHIVQAGDIILVKGSRGMKMEEVVAALIKEEAR